MPMIRTRTGADITFIYEPGSSRVAEGAKRGPITVTPGGVMVSSDICKVALATYEKEIERVPRKRRTK